MSHVVSLKLPIWRGFGFGLVVVGEPGVGARELCCPGVAPDVVRRPSARCSGPRTPADALCGLGFSCADARDTCPSLSLTAVQQLPRRAPWRCFAAGDPSRAAKLVLHLGLQPAAP